MVWCWERREESLLSVNNRTLEVLVRSLEREAELLRAVLKTLRSLPNYSSTHEVME